MSYSQIAHEIEGITMAGWEKDFSGFWKHSACNGLHSLKSAIAITNRWAN